MTWHGRCMACYGGCGIAGHGMGWVWYVMVGVVCGMAW